MRKTKKTRSFADRVFASFLDDGERILHVAHRHILVFKVAAAKASFFGIVLPLFLWYVFPQIPSIFPMTWLFIGVMSLFYHFIDWYYDVWLLTNLGVVDIERNGLFDVNSTRIEYHMIEGLSYQITGVIRTIFSYGHITIDKLGNKTSVKLMDAASPKKLERLVLRLQDQYVRTRSVRDHDALKGMLSEMLAYHVHSGRIDIPLD